MGTEDWDQSEAFYKRVAISVDRLQRPRDAARIARHIGLLRLKQYESESKTNPVNSSQYLVDAEDELFKALKGFEEIESPRGIGNTYRCLAMLRRLQGRLEDAEDNCRKSLEIARSNDSRSFVGEAMALEELSAIRLTLPRENVDSDRGLKQARNIYWVIGHTRKDLLTEQLWKEGKMNPELPTPLSGVLFDLMDTLAYLEAGAYLKTQERLAEELSAQESSPVTVERFRWAWGNSRARASKGEISTTIERFKIVAEELNVKVSDNQLDELVDLEDAMWKESVYIDDQTHHLLQTIRGKRIKVAIISNGPVAMDVLKGTLHLDVDAFVLSSNVGTLKPEKGIYAEALKRLGLRASECVYVGDGNDRELDGAREVGLYAIRRKLRHARPEYASLKNESMDWDWEFDQLDEFRQLIESS